MRRLRRAGGAAAAFVTALATMSAGAAAGPPVHETLTIDDTFVLEENPCGFPIQEHVEGTERISFYFDRDGDLTRMRIHAQNLRVTFTNLESGDSVEGHINNTAHVDIAEEGPHTVRITGLFGHLLVPGQGVVEHESGLLLLVTTGPGDPNPTIERLVGHMEGAGGPFPGLCDVLDGD